MSFQKLLDCANSHYSAEAPSCTHFYWPDLAQWRETFYTQQVRGSVYSAIDEMDRSNRTRRKKIVEGLRLTMGEVSSPSPLAYNKKERMEPIRQQLKAIEARLSFKMQ